MTLCIFTDASHRYYSEVVTQTNPDGLSKPLEDQKNQPIACLGSAFRKTELNWTTFEKEAFAIVQCFKK